MTDIDQYSDSDLLRMAYNMLTVAKEEQERRKRGPQWLSKNRTYDVIQARVRENLEKEIKL